MVTEAAIFVRMRIIGSAFHGAGRKSAHQLLLEHEEQDHERERSDDHARERDVELVDARAAQLLQADLDGAVAGRPW